MLPALHFTVLPVMSSNIIILLHLCNGFIGLDVFCRGVRLAKNDFGSVLQKKIAVFGSVSVLLN